MYYKLLMVVNTIPKCNSTIIIVAFELINP